MFKKLRDFVPVVILMVLFAGCLDSKKNAVRSNSDAVAAVSAHPVKAYVGTGKLIPINFKDSDYVDVAHYAKDTVTNGGWSVKYLVKDDSTRYRDIYIQWQKGDRKGIYTFEEVLEFRRYFIPVYKGESENHLFLTHACATSCEAVLTLSKEKKPESRTFVTVAGFSIPDAQIVFVSDAAYNEKKFSVSVIDLNKNIEKVVAFKNRQLFNEPDQNIDSIAFGRSEVKLFATLIDKNDQSRKKTVRETQVVRF